jgi:hypothetical protein
VTAADAIRLTRQHVERQFPKVCGTCGQRFESLVEYLRQTTHVGDVTSLDAQMGDWRPQRPAGTLSLANCRCGTTLAIGSHGMGLITLWRLLPADRQGAQVTHPNRSHQRRATGFLQRACRSAPRSIVVHP